jgi:uncharacterized membrane protein
MSLFLALKLVHILLAIVAVGFNATYGVWLARAARDPDHRLFALRGIKTLDDRFANPAYVLLILSGLAMVAVSGIPLGTFWIAAALVLYAILVAVGLGFYSPILRRQISALESGGAGTATYQSLERRGTAIGIILAVVAVAIVVLMVTKPTL